MSYGVLPKKRSPGVVDDAKTDVFMQLRRMLSSWRSDPDRLAVAVACWALVGLASQWLVDEVSSADPHTGIGGVSREEAREMIEKALLRRNRRVLRLRAEGLLMALEFSAVQAEKSILHDVQVDSCVIECRELSLDERIERLRAQSKV